MKLLRKIQALILVRRQMKVVGMALNIIRKATTMKEVERPISVLKQLADSGFTPALTALGMVFSMDDVPWYDLKQAKTKLEAASEQGDIEAQYELGSLYYVGRKDFSPDPINGKYWMELAASKGHPLARRFLQAMYETN